MSDPNEEKVRVINHPRDEVCQDAGAELYRFLKEWKTKYGLMPWEYAYLLNVVMGRHAQENCLVERNT